MSYTPCLVGTAATQCRGRNSFTTSCFTYTASENSPSARCSLVTPIAIPPMQKTALQPTGPSGVIFCCKVLTSRAIVVTSLPSFSRSQQEEVDYRCSACPGACCLMRCQLLRLPRVLVLTLKRYGLATAVCEKRTDSVHIPPCLSLKKMVVPMATPPLAFADSSSGILG